MNDDNINIINRKIYIILDEINTKECSYKELMNKCSILYITVRRYVYFMEKLNLLRIINKDGRTKKMSITQKGMNIHDNLIKLMETLKNEN